MDNDKPRIGAKIRQLRRAKEITQIELAAMLGMTQAAVSRIERCDSDVNSVLALKFAEVLGVTVAELFEQSAETKETAA